MAENRITRELETRELSQRPATWMPPQLLPDPTPQAGWAFRWVRIALMGNSDPTNTSASFREGWEPCKAEDHPELMLFRDPNSISRFKDNVEIGGLLLCKTREELVKQRKDYFQKLTNSQMDAVDNSYMRQKDERSNMSLFSEKKTQVSFGRGGKS